jgi:hypothetical protein
MSWDRSTAKARFEDLQRDRGRRHGECQARDQSPAPTEQPKPDREARDRERAQRKLRSAEQRYRAPHCDELAELKLESDQEQQHDDPKFGHAQDRARRAEDCQPERADHDAGDQVGDDRRDSDPPRDRNADDRRCEQNQRQRQDAEFSRGLVHARFPGRVGPLACGRSVI